MVWLAFGELLEELVFFYVFCWSREVGVLRFVELCFLSVLCVCVLSCCHLACWFSRSILQVKVSISSGCSNRSSPSSLLSALAAALLDQFFLSARLDSVFSLQVSVRIFGYVILPCRSARQVQQQLRHVLSLRIASECGSSSDFLKYYRLK